MKDMTSIADADGVTGVMAALIPCDAVEALGKDVDNLPLPFVAPLSAYDCEILFHYRCLSRAFVITLLSTAPTICSFT